MTAERIARVALVLVALMGLLVPTSWAAAATLRSGAIGPRGAGLRLAASQAGNFDGRHTCAVIADGSVRCWGDNDRGQLGNGSFDSSSLPVTVITSGGSPLTGVVSVAASRSHSCAARVDGTVFCWGNNTFAELGAGSTVGSSNRALQVKNSNGSVFNGVVAVTAGREHNCALQVDGRISCWGSNAEGALGTGNSSSSANPVSVVTSGGSPLTGIVSVAAGSFHTCAVQVGGTTSTVHCWGRNLEGQLGIGSADEEQNTPVKVTVSGGGDFTNAVTVAAGVGHTCALRANGQVHCWGQNNQGQIGNNSTNPALNPVQVLTNAVALATGAFHTCAVVVRGTVRCWGLNDQGQIGNNQTGGTRLTPTTVTTAKLGDAVAVTAGFGHSCARRVDDSVRCWGDNGLGQLGNSTNTDEDEPVTVVGIDPAPSGRGIAAGQLHTCAGRASGEAACWGDNSVGQLGNTTQTDQPSPVAVRDPVDPSTTLRGVLAVAAGGSHACGLRVDGTVLCWGRNAEGQLGNVNAGTFSTIPVQVGNLTDAVAVVAGFFHTCALRVGGTVRCWGRNNQGQLGDGTTDNRATPVTVTQAPGGGNLANVVAITAGANGSCALQSSGAVRCWGANGFGQLGDQTTVANSLRAVSVVSLPDATALAAVPVANHNCALRADGSLRCWGRNFEGQLGDGTTTSHNFPVPVNGVTGAVALTAGSGQSCAVVADSTVRCWGRNDQGQLGNGSTTTPDPPAPVLVVVGFVLVSGQPPIPIPLGGAVALAGGGLHTCALLVNGLVGCWGDNGQGQIGDGSTGTDRVFPTGVSSFTFNVEPAVTLGAQNRVAQVTALATCELGAVVQVHIELIQGTVSGRGHTAGRCTGALERYPVRVPAQGPEGFVPGPATAVADAVVRHHGDVVEEPHWTRAVELGP